MWQIVGQERAVSLLQRSLETAALSHAYLLVGPPHVGKMTLALNLAQAVNCGAAEPPCTQCLSCLKIAAAKHADVLVIGLSPNGGEDKSRTEISIDQIREIQHAANLPPFEGRYKVFIIDGAEQLSTEAANCLLKTLEEPAGRVIFILLTTAERLLLPTVVSRCQRLELAPSAYGELEKALSARGIESSQAKLLARLSHGCPGWAFRAVADNSIVAQRNEELETLVDMINTNYEERFIYASQLAAQFTKSRESVQEVLELWCDWWRDLLVVKAGCNGGITNIDREDTLVEMAKSYSLAQIKTFIAGIRSAMVQLKQNANARLVLEVLMLNIPGRNNG